jgi:hypothetical protein
MGRTTTSGLGDRMDLVRQRYRRLDGDEHRLGSTGRRRGIVRQRRCR